MMCRSGLDGGRRCPSHTNEDAVQARNDVRREQYADKKLRESTTKILEENNITFYRGDEVKNVYFQGKEKYTHESFQPVENPKVRANNYEFFWSKPERGGLWTAPGEQDEQGRVKTTWTDFTHNENFMVSDEALAPIRVKKQAIIVRIDSIEDVDRLCKQFPHEDETGKSGGFSWEDMAKAGIDGVQLSNKGVRASKGGSMRMASFSSWDVDSTVWLNNTNISTGKPTQKSSYVIVPEPEVDYNDESTDYSIDTYQDDTGYLAQLADGTLTLDDFDFSDL